MEIRLLIFIILCIFVVVDGRRRPSNRGDFESRPGMGDARIHDRNDVFDEDDDETKTGEVEKEEPERTDEVENNKVADFSETETTPPATSTKGFNLLFILFKKFAIFQIH